MNEQQAKRIKNILEGDVTGKATIGIGYEAKKQDYKEGDIWEENGKKFTISDGIKISYSKLSQVRKMNILPLICPKCGKAMNKKQDKIFYFKTGMCFNCVIERDTQLMEKGQFGDFEKNILLLNMKSLNNDLKQIVKDYVNNYLNNHFVTEFGDVEEWQLKANPEEVQKVIDKALKEFEEIILKREQE